MEGATEDQCMGLCCSQQPGAGRKVPLVRLNSGLLGETTRAPTLRRGQNWKGVRSHPIHRRIR